MSPEARERSFDELTRGLASGSISRRRALRLMGAALVAGTLASLGIGEAAADPPGCKRGGKKCSENAQCCSDICVNGTCAGLNRVFCQCRDLTEFTTCRSIDCTSAEQQDLVCVPLCESHEGLRGTGCTFGCRR
jgi:hypothetical protein